MIRHPPNSTLFPPPTLSRSALAVQLEGTPTRRDFILSAAFQLRRLEDNRPVYTSLVRRVASYDVRRAPFATLVAEQDRKSTRLNSSHANISYAVFCLKKKKI